MKSFIFSKFHIVFAIFIPKILQITKTSFNEKEVRDFFVNVFSDAVNHRRREKVIRKDFLNLIMQLLDFGEQGEDESIIPNGQNKGMVPITFAFICRFIMYTFRKNG